MARRVLTAAVARARGEEVAVPASSRALRDGSRVVKVPVTLNVNGVAYELELDPVD